MLPELFDDFFDDDFELLPRSSRRQAMRCDVRENDNDYELDMSMPGANKDDVKISLKDGYLNISYDEDHSNDQKDEQGHVIRQERFHGSMRRSFYVGEDMKKEDIRARFDNGVLRITVPKRQEAIENNDYIAIE